MSGGGTQQTVTQDIDPEFKARTLGLFNDAQDFLNATPFQPFPGQQVAGLQPFQRAAQSFLGNSLLGTDPGFAAPQSFGPFFGPSGHLTGADPINPNFDPNNPNFDPLFDPTDPNPDPGNDAGDRRDGQGKAGFVSDGPIVSPQPLNDPFGGQSFPFTGPMFPGSAQNAAASNTALGLSGFQPQQVQPGQANAVASVTAERVNPQQVGTTSSAAGIAGFQNPFEDQVVNQTLQDLARANEIQQQFNRSGSSGTFGGDRQVLRETEQDRNFLDAASRASSQLRSAGFDRAAQLSQADADRFLRASGLNQGAGLSAGLANQGAGLTASLANQGALNDFGQFNTGLGFQGQLANQAAGLAGGGLNLNAASALNQFGNSALNNTLGVGSALNQIGTQNQQLAQSMINAELSQFDQARNAGLRDFGVLQSILSGTPVGINTTTTQPGNAGAAIGGGILGLLGAGLGGGLFNGLLGVS